MNLIIKFCLIFLAFILCNQKNISGQDKVAFQYGDVTVNDFILPASPVLDSSEGAVIIADIGKTSFIGNEYRYFSYVYKKYSRILILKNSAFDLATLKIPLYVPIERKSQLNEVKAAVYNLENGKVIKSEFNKNDLFEDKINSNTSEYKLTLPSVKEGSIIEYSYTITSYRYFDIPDWYFQHLYYPCLYSEYEVIFPDAMRFLVTKYGIDSFSTKETSTVKNNKYIMGDLTVISNDMKQRWVMKDVPSFKDEKFIFSPYGYLDKIEFTLAQTYNGEDIQNLRTSWYAVTNDLLDEKNFGRAIEKDNNVNLLNTVEKVTAGDKTLLESARSIYLYVRDNFTYLSSDRIFLRDDLYNINKKKKGNAADLNLLLIALLRQKGIDADPVILSTREFGKNSPEFPLLEKMNYVICMTRSFGDTIFLDATNPYLGFGQLSLDCYNGHARVISKRIYGDVYFSTERIKENEITSVFITNESGGKLGGSCELVLGDFKTEILRNEIKGSAIRQYFEDIRTAYGSEIEIVNTGIDSLNKPGSPAKVHFEFTIPASDDILYFNPVIFTEYKQNPFKAEKRKYPVSLPLPIDNLYTLNMEIPEGYTIDELPKSAKVSFNEDQGIFEYAIQANQNSLKFRSRIILKEVFFPPENYQSLRDFFAFIIKKFNEQVVFKKKK